MPISTESDSPSLAWVSCPAVLVALQPGTLLGGQIPVGCLPQCGQDRKLLPWKSPYWARTLSWAWVQHAIQPPGLQDHGPGLCGRRELALDGHFTTFHSRWTAADRRGGMCQWGKPHPLSPGTLSIRALEGAWSSFQNHQGLTLHTTSGAPTTLLRRSSWFLPGQSMTDLTLSAGASSPTPESCSSRPLIWHQNGNYFVHYTHADVEDPIVYCGPPNR